MNTQQELNTAVQQALALGNTFEMVADMLELAYPHSSLLEFAIALYSCARRTRRSQASEPLAEPKLIAATLVRKRPSTVTPAKVAITLRRPELYPNLAARDMGDVLKAESVFAQIDEPQMREALRVADYQPAESAAAVDALFPR